MSPPARNHLLHAAATVWASNPSAALDSAARAAGVGLATLHRYFASPPELIRAAALDGIAALADALERSGCFRLGAESALRAVVDARLHRVPDVAVDAGVLRAVVARAWRHRAIQALVYAAWTAVAAGELARLDAPALVHDTLLRGLGVPTRTAPA